MLTKIEKLNQNEKEPKYKYIIWINHNIEWQGNQCSLHMQNLE